jgi:hypothetical protein
VEVVIRKDDQRLETKSEPPAVATGQGLNSGTESIGSSRRRQPRSSVWPVATVPGSDFTFALPAEFRRRSELGES